MTTENIILVDIDPTAENHPAVDRGIWLAKHYDAELMLFICDFDPYADGPKGQESVLKKHRKQLQAIAAKVEEAGVTVTTEVAWDHPIDEALLRKIAEINPSMVVKDTHFHGVLQRTIFSNTDWSLIRNCPADLLLVKPTALGEPVKIVAAVDPLHEHDKPADLDRRIVSAANELANRTYGELSLFHCFDTTAAIAAATTTLGTPIAIPVAEVTTAIEKRHREALDKLAERFGVRADKIHMQQGLPRDLLPTITKQQRTDILVMGAVSRRGLKRIFIGHTAEHVLDRLPCDLLIVKPEDFASRVSSNKLEAS
jgi:universal stress protein E